VEESFGEYFSENGYAKVYQLIIIGCVFEFSTEGFVRFWYRLASGDRRRFDRKRCGKSGGGEF